MGEKSVLGLEKSGGWRAWGRISADGRVSGVRVGKRDERNCRRQQERDRGGWRENENGWMTAGQKRA